MHQINFLFLEGDEKDETDLLIKSPQRLLLIQKHTQTRHKDFKTTPIKILSFQTYLCKVQPLHTHY